MCKTVRVCYISCLFTIDTMRRELSCCPRVTHESLAVLWKKSHAVPPQTSFDRFDFAVDESVNVRGQRHASPH